ncbi:hypothetical protein SLEP1_g36016 [Rubroshorea leprosula]|uniref:Aminotransferase-like plant mobile domain-containing protein n=1 Tax=Rubroshorea leprosula TaxID=152421 RepID=A0AAV5KQ42_9ROSI|nr:hypothetical protein SLEP1_g36016 [Rubroshorea leprosula]
MNMMFLTIIGEKDPCYIMLTSDEHSTKIALRRLMRKNMIASSRSWRGDYSIDFPMWMLYFWISEGKDSLYVCVAFLTTWLSNFIFKGFLNHEIMAKCILLAIRLAKGVKLPLASVMLGLLYHMLELLHADEILGLVYYIIETYACLFLLQMFVWERFYPYYLGRVTSGKVLKEYPMAKYGYSSGTTPLAYSWIGKWKVKGQVVLEIDGFLNDHGSSWTASKDGFNLIPVLDGEDASSKSEEAKEVEALKVNMEEALANLVVHQKILAKEIGEPPLLDYILSLVNSIINWSDYASFAAELAKKAKASSVPPSKRGVKVSYGTPNVVKRPEVAKAHPKVTILKACSISKLPPFSTGKAKVGAVASEGKRKATVEEISFDSNENSKSKSNNSDTSSISKNGLEQRNEDKGPHDSIDINKAASNELELDVGDAMKKPVSSGNLNEMDKDREMSLTRFGLVPTRDAWSVGKVKVTPFVKMNEDSYLCKDVIDDAENINFEVGTIRAHLLDLAKAFLDKGEFGMVGGDMAHNLDRGIEEQAKHVKEMEKSLAEMKEFVLKSEERLKSTKVYLESLNQDKELLGSWEIVQLCHACIKIAKTCGDEPGCFWP